MKKRSLPIIEAGHSKFPEVSIYGTRSGLRRLRNVIDRVLSRRGNAVEEKADIVSGGQWTFLEVHLAGTEDFVPEDEVLGDAREVAQ